LDEQLLGLGNVWFLLLLLLLLLLRWYVDRGVLLRVMMHVRWRERWELWKIAHLVLLWNVMIVIVVLLLVVWSELLRLRLHRVLAIRGDADWGGRGW